MKEISNEITINYNDILNLPDGSVDDCETIRQIGLLGKKELYCKIQRGLEYCALYPFVMKKFSTP